MGFSADFSRKLAARNWVGVTLPKKYGGANLDAFSRFVLDLREGARDTAVRLNQSFLLQVPIPEGSDHIAGGTSG